MHEVSDQVVGFLTWRHDMHEGSCKSCVWLGGDRKITAHYKRTVGCVVARNGQITSESPNGFFYDTQTEADKMVIAF